MNPRVFYYLVYCEVEILYFNPLLIETYGIYPVEIQDIIPAFLLGDQKIALACIAWHRSSKQSVIRQHLNAILLLIQPLSRKF